MFEPMDKQRTDGVGLMSKAQGRVKTTNMAKSLE